jgi:putative chitinase
MEILMTELEPNQLLQGALIAMLLGLFGQGLRAVAGLRKQMDEAATKSLMLKDVFDPTSFWFSLFVGAIAGLAAFLGMTYGTSERMSWDSGKVVLGIAAAGYAGADFIEAFAKKYLPADQASDRSHQQRPAAPERDESLTR